MITKNFYITGTATFKDYVSNNLVTNCEVIVDDVNRAELIYGPPAPYLEELMARTRPLIHERIEKMPLSSMVAQHHLNIFIAMDSFSVNGNIFFYSKPGKVSFLSAQYYKSRSLRTIMVVLEKIINEYFSWSFNITDYHGDNKFDKALLKVFLEPALLHIYGRIEHVGIIEWYTRTIKEKYRSV